MLVATLLTLVGVATTALLSQRRGFRVGGVLVVPLLAVYTFRELLSPVVFAVATAGAWLALWALREYTITHGRRVFLVAVVVGGAVSLAVAALLGGLYPGEVRFRDAEIVGSIFPGVAAYNLMRVGDDRRRADLFAIAASYLGLLALGALLLHAVARVETGLPPVLLLPTSDAVALFDLAPRGTPTGRITPTWLAASVLLADVVVYEGVRARYDVRLAGIILVPLLALFSARYGAAAVVYVVGATVTFFALSVVHWTTLLYGRNLLGVGLGIGTLYALAVGVVVPTAAPGIVVFFIGVFCGIGAYNLHRVAPVTRAANLRLSAGLFVALYAVVVAVVDVPATGFASPLEPWHIALGVVVLGLTAYELHGLERRRPDGAAFARGSVFSDAADADGSESPLVGGGDR